MSLDRLKDFLRDDADVAEGRRMGRYELRRTIARGGSSVVWEAHDPTLDRPVAIKVLRAGNVERLLQEAKAVARLRHPGIVAVYEVGPDYIVMDLVRGRTLAAALPDLDLDARLDVLQAVAATVAYAHGQGVTHRDLKPANIMIADDGRVLLTDFGLAKIADGEDLTMTGAVLGTPEYMAPEQVRGKGFGPTVDVWALGVLLYQAAAGRLPFSGTTSLETYDLIVRRDPRSLAGRLGAVALKALEKDVGRRYAGAAEFGDDLARARRGERVHASRLGRNLRRWAVPGVAALAVVAIATGLWTARRPAAIEGGRPGIEARLVRFATQENVHTRGLEQTPRSIEHLLGRATLRAERGDYVRDYGREPLADWAAAEADLGQVLALDPTSWRAFYLRGRVRAQRAAYKVRHGIDPLAECDGAEADLGRVLQEIPRARNWRGNVRFQRGLWRQRQGLDARGDFESAEADLTPPGDADALMRRGRVRAHLGRFEAAEEDFAASLRAVPASPWAWTWRGLARVMAGDLAGAESHFTQAIAVSPEHAEAWEERGRLRLRRGARADAKADLERAVALDPSLAAAASEALQRAGQ